MTGEEERRRAEANMMTVREVYAILRERSAAIERHFEMQDRAVNAAFEAAKDAVEKAEKASEKRFDSVNEFRGQQRDLIQTFVPRNEWLAQHEALTGRIGMMENAYSNLQGRMWAVSAIAFIITIVVAVSVRFVH